MAQDQLTASPAAAASPASASLVQLRVPQPAGPQGDASTQPSQSAPAATVEAPAKRGGMKRFILLILILAGLGYGAKMGYDWFMVGRFIVTTDDAYVGADTTIMAAKISGYVAEVAVANNQSVRAGDLIARIDPVDYQLAVTAAKGKIASQNATIARVQRQAEAQMAMIAGAEAQTSAARAQLQGTLADEERSALEFDRSQKMAQTNVGSQQRLEQAAADKARTISTAESARANVANAEASLAAARANLDVLKAQKVEAETLAAELKTALDKAEHDLSFTEIRAPFDGVIGNKAVVVGQYAQPGARLLALVAPATTYIDANYKETQLTNIQVGQKVDVAIDSRGGDVVQGTVLSIAPASGSMFSLLPPDNATGNFTKVVQRVAVRIGLSPEDVKAARLIPGLSVVASIHTRDESKPQPTLLGALGLEPAQKTGRAK